MTTYLATAPKFICLVMFLSWVINPDIWLSTWHFHQQSPKVPKFNMSQTEQSPLSLLCIKSLYAFYILIWVMLLHNSPRFLVQTLRIFLIISFLPHSQHWNSGQALSIITLTFWKFHLSLTIFISLPVAASSSLLVATSSSLSPVASNWLPGSSSCISPFPCPPPPTHSFLRQQLLPSYLPFWWFKSLFVLSLFKNILSTFYFEMMIPS